MPGELNERRPTRLPTPNLRVKMRALTKTSSGPSLPRPDTHRIQRNRCLPQMIPGLDIRISVTEDHDRTSLIA